MRKFMAVLAVLGLKLTFTEAGIECTFDELRREGGEA